MDIFITNIFIINPKKGGTLPNDIKINIKIIFIGEDIL